MQINNELRRKAPNLYHSARTRLVLWLGSITAAVLAGNLSAEIVLAPENLLAQIEPGPIAVSSSELPAATGFDKPSGKAVLASEAAADAVSLELPTPHLGNPQLEAVVGAVQFALSPFVAGYAVVRDGHRRLTPERLSEAESDLASAMTESADQVLFRGVVMEAARSVTRRELVELASSASNTNQHAEFAAVLQTRVLELRLLKTRHSDKSFRLRIRTQVELKRASDGSVLFDLPFEYQSGEALFVDWTREDGLASVVRTGYQLLAKQVAQKIFSLASQPPIVVAATQAPAQHPNHFSSFPRKTQGRAKNPGLERCSTVLPVADYGPSYQHSLEITPDFSGQELWIKGLGETPATAGGSETDTEYALDGLENHPNFVVQVAACFGAIPMGLWEHTVGAFRAGSEEALQAADTVLRNSSRGPQPEEVLAEHIAIKLRGRTPEPVWAPTERRPHGHNRTGVKSNSRLEVRVTELSLSGGRGRNPQLSLCVQAQATLIRSFDGQELRSWPFVYRSAPHRLKAWAGDDRVALRNELRQGYDLLAKAVADELISEGLAPSVNPSSSTIAAN